MHQDNDKSLNGEVSSPRVAVNYVDMTSVEEPVHRHSRHSRRSANKDESEDHRERFLSNSERLLVDHPQETRESFASIDATDEWHTMAVTNILKKLTSNETSGLKESEVERRIEKYGHNVLDEEPRPPLWIIYILQFYNMIVGLLILATICSFAIGHTTEGIAIFFILNLNATVATIQERKTGNALEALANLSSPLSLAIRDGQKIQVESKTIVPGDIIVLTTGDVVPADIRLIKSTDFKVNEMLLTGESEDVAKKYNANVQNSKKLTADNMVFSSTTVTAGNAHGVVVETGMSTRVGSIAMLLKSKDSDHESKNCISRFVSKYSPKLTPLQRALHKLGFIMGSIALFVCAVVFITGVVRGTRNPRDLDMATWLFMIMVSVSLAVSAVPEGLPMVVTICLTSGTSDMVKQNVLVRKIAAVETLGAASVICTDKTGTLTEGKMTAVKMFGDFTEYDITGKGFHPEGGIFLDDVNQGEVSAENVQVRSTLLSCVLCSNTHLKQNVEDGVTTWVPMGNSSEAPLVVAAAKAGIWEENVTEEYKRVVEVPFSSSRKMMITVNSVPANGKFDIFELPQKTNFVANVKGAPNYIMNNCTRYMQRNGELSALTDQHRETIMEAVDNLSSKALRVLAVAIRPMEKLPFADDCDDVEEKFAALSQPLTFLGLMASIDPERDGVSEAIRTARHASIRTVMITGDYLKTAIAIAKNIDLIQPGADIETEATDCSLLRPNGEQYLPEAELDVITSRTVVFARAKPEDKIEIVKSLQRQGLISAMTGDGVNDAPALKESDIGVAMGVTGTEVAKGASDMILLDDNFCSIVAAVEKGRIIYANIQKFVIFLLSTNVGEIIFIFSSVAGGLFLPLEPVQILILNLFSDGMPAVALSLEKGDSTVMDDAPRPKTQPLIHGRLWFLVIANALLIASGALTVFITGVYMNFGVLQYTEILKAGFGEMKDKDDKTTTVGVTCQRWYGTKQGWKTYGNCNVKKDGKRLFEFDDESGDVDEYTSDTVQCYAEKDGEEYNCLTEGIGRSQTIAFACITFTEVLRAYTVRSFTEPVWVGIISNKYLQYAAVASVILTLSIANIPYVMDVFGFEYIPYWHWLISVAGALGSVIGGEIIKCFLRRSLRDQAREKAMSDGFESVLVEIRHLRAQVERLEHREE